MSSLTSVFLSSLSSRPVLGSLCLAGSLLACASPSPESVAGSKSVRERLAQPTRLLVSAATSTGTITARRYTHDGWQGGQLALAIADGDFTTTATPSGAFAVSELLLNLQPIDIPESVFGKPARLTDVRLQLKAPTAATDAQWADADDATATTKLELDLSWSIAINGSATPLGAQHLPPVPVVLGLSGTGAHIDAGLSAHATGTVWSWAGLLELDDLDLTLQAATID